MKDIPLSKPEKGSCGKTGLWRFEKPVIDLEKCIKCLVCVVYCPDVSISIVGNTPVINYDFCKGCGICAEECPVKAIKMVVE